MRVARDAIFHCFRAAIFSASLPIVKPITPNTAPTIKLVPNDISARAPDQFRI